MSYVVKVSGLFGNIGPLLIFLTDKNISIKDLKECIEYETKRLEGHKLYPTHTKSPRMHIIKATHQNLIKEMKIREDNEMLSSADYTWYYDSDPESSTFAHIVTTITLVEKASQYKQLVQQSQKK